MICKNCRLLCAWQADSISKRFLHHHALPVSSQRDCEGYVETLCVPRQVLSGRLLGYSLVKSVDAPIQLVDSKGWKYLTAEERECFIAAAA